MMIGAANVGAAVIDFGFDVGGSAPMQGVGVVLSDPLPVGALAFAVMPDLVDIAVSKREYFSADIRDFGNAPPMWQIDRVALGFARIDLDGYRLTIDDARAELILDNLASGQSARIWGSAQLEVRGALKPDAPALDPRQIGRFWGTTSLELDNGMFITCGTAPMEDNADLYRLDRLTITRGLNALIVSAIGGADGDMEILGTDAGYGTDVEVDDGLVLAEVGGRWLTEDYAVSADATYLERTMPGNAYGPGQETWSLREFGRVMLNLVDVVVSGTSSRSVDTMRDHATDAIRHDDDRAAVIRAGQRRAALANAVFITR